MEKNNQTITEEMLLASAAEGLDEFFRNRGANDNLQETHTDEIAFDLTNEVENEDWEEDLVTEDDIAAENGFWVDEDGHWREIPDDDDW